MNPQTQHLAFTLDLVENKLNTKSILSPKMFQRISWPSKRIWLLILEVIFQTTSFAICCKKNHPDMMKIGRVAILESLVTVT